MTVTIDQNTLNTILATLNATGSPVYDAHHLPNGLIRLNIPGLPYPTDTYPPDHAYHPPDFTTIKGVAERTATALRLAGFDTWHALYTATDQELLSLPIITTATLRAIRRHQKEPP